MLRKRAHVILPADLLAEVDRLVGERGRSAFLSDLVRREIQRRNLLAASTASPSKVPLPRDCSTFDVLSPMLACDLTINIAH